MHTRTNINAPPKRRIYVCSVLKQIRINFLGRLFFDRFQYDSLYTGMYVEMYIEDESVFILFASLFLFFWLVIFVFILYKWFALFAQMTNILHMFVCFGWNFASNNFPIWFQKMHRLSRTIGQNFFCWRTWMNRIMRTKSCTPKNS